MDTKLAAAVEDRLKAPTAGTKITLIVGVDSDQTENRISELGGEILDDLPYDSFVVSIDEAKLQQLCNLDGVTSVEIEKEYHTLEDDDFFCH